MQKEHASEQDEKRARRNHRFGPVVLSGTSNLAGFQLRPWSNDTSTDSNGAEPSLYATPLTVTAPAFTFVPDSGSRM